MLVSKHEITRLTFEWPMKDLTGRDEAEDYITENYDDILCTVRCGLKPIGDMKLDVNTMQWVVDVYDY